MLAGVAVAAVLPERRGAGGVPSPAPARRRRRWVLPVVVGGAALVAVGGTAAVGVALLGAAAMVIIRELQPNVGAEDRRRLRRLSRAGVRWLPVACFAVAGWLTVTGEGHTAALPQLAAVCAVTALWVPVAFGRRRGH
jgi:arabinofuranan 3-O-arabinosyltransferase